MRFKKTLANILKNSAERERNRRKYIPSVPIHQEFVPGGVTADDLIARGTPESDPKLLDDFRELVQRQLGAIAVRIFDVRQEGIEMKTLPGVSPYAVKKTVQEIKALAKKYAIAVGDPRLLRQIERMMAAEEMTVQRRKAAMQPAGGGSWIVFPSGSKRINAAYPRPTKSKHSFLMLGRRGYRIGDCGA